MAGKKKEPITPNEARARIKEIKDKVTARDFGAASRLEFQLFQDIFDTIQLNKDIDEAIVLAKLAEKIYSLDFPRDQQ
jgi:hypothetical protein